MSKVHTSNCGYLRLRGTAADLVRKFDALALEATDPASAENYRQHAAFYQLVMHNPGEAPRADFNLAR